MKNIGFVWADMKNTVFRLIVVVVVFVGLSFVYHLISYDPYKYVGEQEIHGLVFKGKVPKPIVLESFDFSNPTYRVEGGLQKIGDSKEDFSTLLVSMNGGNVNVLAFTDDNRTYFASEEILSWIESVKYLMYVKWIKVGETFDDGFNLEFYYTKDWTNTISVSLLCVVMGMGILYASRRALYRKREKKVAQPAEYSV